METKTNKKISLEYNQFIDPLFIIAQMEIIPGNIIADFGCGAGYFSIPLSQSVGKDGKIYAFDVLPQALESVESRAKLAGISNIITKRVNLENKKGSGLENESVDWVIIKDMLFQNHKKELILEEARRILKPEGKVLVIEWDEQNLAIGPEKKLRISAKELAKMIEKQKFSMEKVIKAGNFHYALVVAK
jgi:ubiquinone/menaquinone biosynthesis C-methylase UbiE